MSKKLSTFNKTLLVNAYRKQVPLFAFANSGTLNSVKWLFSRLVVFGVVGVRNIPIVSERFRCLRVLDCFQLLYSLQR